VIAVLAMVLLTVVQKKSSFTQTTVAVVTTPEPQRCDSYVLTSDIFRHFSP